MAAPTAVRRPAGEARTGLPRFRISVRTRLTALYAGLLLLAGIVLLAVTYLLVKRSLETRLTVRVPGSAAPGGAIETQNPTALRVSLLKTLADAQSATLHALVYQFLLVFVAVAILATLLGWTIADRALRPLHQITDTARRVADSRLHDRIALEGPDDELKDLADTFDAMLDRLEQAFAGQRRFVANASHELRTPLAINRTLIEVALANPAAPPETRQLGRALLATNERTERLIEGLLTLARSQHELTKSAAVDLAEIAARAVEYVDGEADSGGVTVRSRLAPAHVTGDGVLLERLALNLVQNAVRHNVPGGWVDVVTSERDGRATMVVANTGPVVPACEVEGLFEPFRRLRAERTGSEAGVGLGLSIVLSVARAHRGEVFVEPRQEGGLAVRVVLPPPRPQTRPDSPERGAIPSRPLGVPSGNNLR